MRPRLEWGSVSLLSDGSKAIMPWRARAFVRRVRRRVVLDRTIGQLKRLESVRHADSGLIERLSYGWGNESWAAKPGYLAAVASEAGRSEGPILECGSGLTTLILGVEAMLRGVRVLSLEHHEAWIAQVSSSLARYRLDRVELLPAPLGEFSDFDWYEAPLARLPGSFALVVCDGPPAAIRGGRHGLVPILGDRLRPGCVILLDDLERESERRILDDWRRSLDATVEVFGERDQHARIVVGAAAGS